MDYDFDWRIEDDNSGRPPRRRQRGSLSALRFWVVGLTVLLVLGGLWLAALQSNDRAHHETQLAIQATLDQARDACRSGNGDRFFALQTRDPVWQAALLRPELSAAYCAGATATRVQRIGPDYSANLSWTADGRTWQRLAFFTLTPRGMTQIPTPDATLGDPVPSLHTWGTLVVPEADGVFAASIGRFVDDLVATTCSTTTCLPDRLPFTLEIRPDYWQTADPHTLYASSPRLLALDETGAPGPVFWGDVRQMVVAHLTPGTIRFAVPPLLQQVINFEREAAIFMRENPDITVEIVEMDALPEQPSAELAAYDGAAYTPSAGMVAAGLVRDITDYATSDPRFDAVDFYEQIWQGAWWRERMWFMPQAGQMRLLFLDCSTCEAGIFNRPSLRWTWDEMMGDVLALLAAPPPAASVLAPTWTGDWALLDTTRDTLLSYAYGQQTGCAGIVPARCTRALGPDEVAAALEWYRHMTVDLEAMPDVVAVSPDERSRLMVNWQAVGRRAAMWVDEPVNYEHQLQFWRISVVPFPGSDRFDGNTPFWVHGSFISQSSERPLDVWRWLVFLSERPLVGALRYVPARPSMAEQMDYWAILPPPLGEAMRTAFPFARPVRLGDRQQFSRMQLKAVTQGELTPLAAARLPTSLPWFQNGE